MVDREKKGKSLIEFPDDYVVIDIETTGLSPEYDSIIEISALKVRDNSVVDKFNSLVKPPLEDGTYVSPFIENLTGISNEQLEHASEIKYVLIYFYKFIGNSILVGHNVNKFDINFLYDNSLENINVYLENDFIDTYRLFNKLYPDMKHHRLSDLCNVFKINNENEHRALSDSEATLKGFISLKENIKEKYGEYSEFQKLYKDRRKRIRVSLNDLVGDESKIDKDNFLYKKRCVFTGPLTRYVRKEAAQIVKNIGGIPQDNVTKTTDVLIISDIDYPKKHKSNSRKKAEKYYLEGQNIVILPETTFYNLINE